MGLEEGGKQEQGLAASLLSNSALDPSIYWYIY